MSKSAPSEVVAAEDSAGGDIIAVFPTFNGNFRYFVEEDRSSALQTFTEEKNEGAVALPPNLM